MNQALNASDDGHRQRNTSLDLLRSAAILLVVNCHVAVAFADGRLRGIIGLGGVGVDLFFGLSGWLLGRQLLKELQDTDGIDIRRFWIRRWLRTLPAYYAVLFFTYFWQIALKQNWNLDYSYLIFGQTYLSTMPYFGVSWSLCVEEHFYLLVAPLLLLLRCSWGRWGLLFLLFMPVALRHSGMSVDSHQTHVRWDQCGVGVLLAYWSVYCPAIWARLCRLAGLLAGLGLIAAISNVMSRGVPAWPVSDLSVTAWTAISTSLVLLANSSEFWRTGTYCRVARFISERSYSLYLLHVEAIVLVRKIPGISFPVALPLVWIVSLILAEVLYRGVERPFLRARGRWAWSRQNDEAERVI